MAGTQSDHGQTKPMGIEALPGLLIVEPAEAPAVPALPGPKDQTKCPGGSARLHPGL